MKRLDHRVVLCPSANFSRLTFAAGGEQATVARCLHGTAFIIPTPMETGLKNRVAIVAASSQGIGRATAEAFAAEGCRVAMCASNGDELSRSHRSPQNSRLRIWCCRMPFALQSWDW